MDNIAIRGLTTRNGKEVMAVIQRPDSVTRRPFLSLSTMGRLFGGPLTPVGASIWCEAGVVHHPQHGVGVWTRQKRDFIPLMDDEGTERLRTALAAEWRG